MMLCKDCNFVRDGEIYECHHPRNIRISFIDGSEYQVRDLYEFRTEVCGIDKAIYFEPKRGD